MRSVRQAGRYHSVLIIGGIAEGVYLHLADVKRPVMGHFKGIHLIRLLRGRCFGAPLMPGMHFTAATSEDCMHQARRLTRLPSKE